MTIFIVLNSGVEIQALPGFCKTEMPYGLPRLKSNHLAYSQIKVHKALALHKFEAKVSPAVQNGAICSSFNEATSGKGRTGAHRFWPKTAALP